MKLQIGLTISHPGWELLLRQEGIPFLYLNTPDDLDPSQVSAVVAPSTTSEDWNDQLKSYASKGGGIILSGEQYLRIFGGKGRRADITHLLPEANRPFWDAGIVDIYQPGVVLEGASLCQTPFGAPSISMISLGEGLVIATPVDLGQLAVDTRRSRKSFFHNNTRLPDEKVSLVGKGGVHRLTRACLETVHLRRGIPYVHLWYYPDGVQNVFVLRIDTDFGTREEIDRLHELIDRCNVKASWFVHTGGHAGWLDRFAAIPGHEIGVHCSDHSELRSYSGSRKNLLAAMDALRKVGLDPSGVAAPYGQLYAGYQRAIAELGFLYSSEFSYDYDNFPSYPISKQGSSPVLQLPVHPICIGSLRNCRITEDGATRYFDRVIERKKITGEPLFFYHHPNDGMSGVLEKLIKSCLDGGALPMRMHDFALWWKDREAARHNIVINGKQIFVQGKLPAQAFLRIVTQSGEAIVPASSMDMGAMNFQMPKQATTAPEEFLRIKRFSPRRSWHSVLNFMRRSRV